MRAERRGGTALVPPRRHVDRGVRWRQPVVRHPTGSAVSAHVDHELRGMRQPRRVLQLSAVDVLPR